MGGLWVLGLLSVAAVFIVAACGGRDAATSPTTTPGSAPPPTQGALPGMMPTPGLQPDPTATIVSPPGPAVDSPATGDAGGTPKASTPGTPASTPGASASEGPGPADSVRPDESLTDLELSALSQGVWKTDFRLHSVPYSEIIPGGPPRDGIPPLDDPQFTTVSDANEWVGSNEPVIAFEVDGDARAYPLQILIWHEIVNDVVSGVPVSVTFCPLCNSAIVFDRRLEGVVYDFGTSGKLRNSDLVMWDRQTESWWQQLTGEAIVGELTGKALTALPAPIISWQDFKDAHPEGKVLSRDTGFPRPYGENPYVGYDKVDEPPFLYRGSLDGRLPPKERVAAVTIGEVNVAFPFSLLEAERVVSYSVNGRDVVVFFKPGTASALDSALIQDSRDAGATGVFDPSLDGQKYSFREDGGRITDDETGSAWNILGEATEGPLRGKKLTPLVHANHFWFAWGAFRPDTIVYEGAIS